MELLQTVIAVIGAIAGLGTAAYGLVDASKALWGGIANVGFGHIERGLAPFQGVLARGAGSGELWRDVLRAQWRNGRAKEDQIGVARNLVRLGLTEGAVEDLSFLANVTPDALRGVSLKLRAGAELDTAEMNVLGRIDAVIGVRLDAAFERAEQQYRNVARLAAGAVAVALALGAGALLEEELGDGWIGLALIVGLLAVPIAPLAKDLISGLSAAMHAVKAARAL